MALQVGELYAQLTMDSKPFDKGIQGLKGSLGKVGGLVAGALGGIVLGGVAALGGAMVAGVSKANDYQKAMNNLQTQTGATASEMDSMGDAVKNVYARNFGTDMNDVASTMALVKQSTGAAGEELEYLTQDALMLRDAFGYDVTQSITASDKLMREFGKTGTESMAMIAEATQAGLNKNGDLIETIDEYSIYFAQAGLSAEDMFGVMESASAAGVRNLDYVGDAVKEFGIRAKDGSKTTNEAFTAIGLDAGKMGSDMAAGGEKGKNAYLKTIDALGKMKDPMARNAAGVALFGTKFEDLEWDAVQAMGNINGSVTGSVETLDSINAIKYDSFGEAFAGIGRQLEVGLFIPLGEKILPLLNDFATWVATKIPGVVEFFTNLGNKVVDVFNRFSGPLMIAKEKVSGFVEGVVEIFKRFVGSLTASKDKVSGFVEGLKSTFSRIMGIVGPAMEFTRQKVMEVVSAIVAWWKSNGSELLANVMIVFNGILGIIEFVMPLVLAIVSMIWGNVKGVIMGALDIISGVFKIFAGLFTGDWAKMWDGVKQLLSGAVKLLWNLWNLLLVGKLLAGIKLLGVKALGLFKGMFGGIKNGWSSFISGVNNLVNGFISKVVGFFTSLFTRSMQIFRSMRSIGGSIFNSLKQAIYNAILTMKNKVVGVIGNLKSSISTKFSSILSTATRIFNSVKNAITKPIQSAKTTIDGIIAKIKSAFNNMKLKLPKFKLPKINIGSKKGLMGLTVPTFDVDWFKTGGIATGPAIAGIGEAGSEAIVPLSGRRMRPFATETAKEIAKAMGGSMGGNDGDYIVVEVNIDGDKIVKATAKKMKVAQEEIDIKEARKKGRKK